MISSALVSPLPKVKLPVRCFQFMFVERWLFDVLILHLLRLLQGLDEAFHGG